MFSISEIQQFSEGTYFKEADILKIQQVLHDNKYQLKKRSDYQNQSSFTNQFLLGRGGQALVFLGENFLTKDEVAIKISRSDREIYEDMIKEIKATEKIFNYDFIVQVHHSFMLDQEMICIQIIELCSKSLDDEIQEMKTKGQSYSFEQVAFILLSAINSLCEIHTNDIIHFDIKPSNILISKQGTYKLADFGHAKSVSLEQSHIYSFGYGTITYQSPEQQSAILSGNKGNDRQKLRSSSDIYSMGVSLLQVLGINADFMIINALLQNDFSQLDAKIDKKYLNFYTFIKHFMLQKESTQRYSAIRLREQFIKTFNSQFNIDHEEKRIKKQIDLYEHHKIKENKKYLSYLYYFLSSIKEEQNDDQLILKSLSNIKDTILDGKFEESLFCEHLSYIYLNQGKYQLSLEYLERSNQLKQQLFGEIHIECALINLCFCYYWRKTQLNLQKLLECSLKSLELFELNFHKNHPAIALSTFYIGISYSCLGDYYKGLEYDLKALEMRELLYQGNHPEIAQSLENIGCTYHTLGELKRGLEYNMKALKMREELYQGNHPSIAESLYSIGCSYHNMGEVQKGLEYCIKVKQMREALYQGNHPSIAESLYSIGCLYHTLGQFKESLEYKLKGLTMRQELYKSDHPEIAQTLYSIGCSYHNLGDLKQGLEYNKKALLMREALYHGNHPDIAESLDSIGCSYHTLGELQSGLEYNKKALKMREELYQENHPDIADSFYSVGCSYEDLGELERGLEYKLKSLQMYEVLETNKDQMIEILESIRRNYKKQGDDKKIIEYSKKIKELKIQNQNK